MRRVLWYSAGVLALVFLAWIPGIPPESANGVVSFLLALPFLLIMVVAIESVRRRGRGDALTRAVIYIGVGLGLALLAVWLGPTLMGIPQPGSNSDPDGGVTRNLDALPILALTLVVYLIVVVSIEVFTSRPRHLADE